LNAVDDRFHSAHKIELFLQLMAGRDLALLDALRADSVDAVASFVHETDDIDHQLRASPTDDTMIQCHPTLVCAAAFFGSVRCFEFLHLNGANLLLPDRAGRRLCHFCSAGGSDAIFDQLENLGVAFDRDVADSGMDSVLYAAKYNRLLALRRLAGRNSDLNRRSQANFNAVCYACSVDNAVMLHFLLSRGVDGDYLIFKDRRPVTLASESGNVELLRVFLRWRIPIDVCVNGLPALVHAAKTGNAQFVELLLGGVDVDVRDACGWTPLHWAASRGNADVAQMLIRAGADVNSMSARKMTPTHLALNRGHSGAANVIQASGGMCFVN
jgi:ankyrin repeat protein